ncbi:hypothetical protein [Nocardioides abyssi]|uniref:Uncharacterized protein n=1 Tax=Nocardioides abyssi TaxID=3058370 RepID=A0ABT8ET59_9ACTN|nr:hypothetical protein [Nocardioides abyssi]MDN4161106.1 hypothetical protein [Nocardioides abyssi]
MVAIVLVILTGVGALIYRSSEPTAFDSFGNGMAMRLPEDGSRTLLVDVGYASSTETVTLRSARAAVVQNTANADIEFFVCGIRQRVGASFDPVEQVCSGTTAIGGHRFVIGSEKETVMMAVTPRRAGQVVLRGAIIEYARGARHLWQTGEERIGPVVRIETKQARPADSR